MVLLRDIMFGDKHTFRELLNNSLEGVATNILGNRLKKLVAEGFLTAKVDPDHKQRTIYNLTEKAFALLPAMIAHGAWGKQFLPTTLEYAIRIQVLEEGEHEMQDAFKDELRERHLNILKPRTGRPVSEQHSKARSQRNRKAKLKGACDAEIPDNRIR